MDSLHHMLPLSTLSALKRPALKAFLVEQSDQIVELRQTIAERDQVLAERCEEIARLKKELL